MNLLTHHQLLAMVVAKLPKLVRFQQVEVFISFYKKIFGPKTKVKFKRVPMDEKLYYSYHNALELAFGNTISKNNNMLRKGISVL